MPAESSERILVRGVNWLGDAIMATPALQRLREAYPSARITLLTHEKLKDLWPGHPSVDAVETFSPTESAWSIGRRLRETEYNIALALPNSHRSAIELWLARVPRRYGAARAGRNFFLTNPVASRPGAVRMRKRSSSEINGLIQTPPVKSDPLPPQGHHIFHYLHLVAAMGGNSAPLAPLVAVSGQEMAHFEARFELAPQDADNIPCFGLNPGAEYGPAKRWPEERFIAAAIEIQKRAPCRWLVFGIKPDFERGARIAAAICRAAEQNKRGSMRDRVPPAINLSGLTNLRELCAGLKLCRVLLSNDSGPMHLAAAVGTPVVVPFGSTSPALTGPGFPGDSRHHLLQSRAPCSPCFLRYCPIDFRCMTGIGVDTVVGAVLSATA